MKISKLSGIDTTNDWLSNFTVPKTDSVKAAKVSPQMVTDVVDVSPLSPEAVDDTVLAFECDKIEKCASSNKPYFYNQSWNSEQVSSLKEYASVCGLPLTAVIAAEYKAPVVVETVKTASTNGQNKTGVKSEVKKVAQKLDLGDPFKIEERSNTDHMNAKDWQVNTPSQKLELNPVMTGGIVPVRGGENYNIQNTPKLASNQNSMSNPSAIEDLATSEQMDNGTRLANERQAKVAKKIQEKKQWEQDLIDSMVHKDIVAHGKVFPTEMLNAQSGLSSPASQRIAGNFNPDDMAEKTAGEMIKANNKVRHEAISRPQEDDKWEEARGESLRGISDSFTESLKKSMGK